MRIKKEMCIPATRTLFLSSFTLFPLHTLSFSHLCSHDLHLLVLGDPMLQLHCAIAHYTCLKRRLGVSAQGGVTQA